MRRRRRDSPRSLLAVLVLFALIGAGLWWFQRHGPGTLAGTAGADSPPVASGPTAPPGTTWPGGRPRPQLPARVVDALALVPVGQPDRGTGYSRLLFGSDWLDPDGNGCDARSEVLRRDLTEVEIRPRTNGCIVERGVLRDPYTGIVERFQRGPTTSDAVQVDHVVALSNAWRTGAQAWTPAQRAAFANDPLELLAVRKASNADKDYQDVAGWLPPEPSRRCAFVARVVAVKAAYGLRMTQAEHDTAAAVLTTCPEQPSPR